MFFAGVSLLQDDPFDAVPERPKHEENQEQSEGESQCPPVRRLIDRRIGYIAVDGGQQTDDADEEDSPESASPAASPFPAAGAGKGGRAAGTARRRLRRTH